MFLSAQKVKELVESGEIQIEPFTIQNMKGASYTFTLGRKAKAIRAKDFLDSREDPDFDEFVISEEGYTLNPGQFVILYTKEKVNLNNTHTCILSTRATIAQMGLDVTQSSFFCEPDTNNQFALECTNRGSIPVKLYPGTKIVKGIFSKLN